MHKPFPKQLPPPSVPPTIPRELSKATIPDYVIEPPDVLAVSAISLVPKHPYHLRPMDTLIIQASGIPEEAPIGGEYRVGLDGKLVIGFDYDNVLGPNGDKVYQPIQAAGRSIEEVREELLARMADFREPNLWITLSSIASQQEVQGEHLVAADGRITLGSYGRVCVVGMTIDDAKQAIEAHLSSSFEDPKVSVDVFGFNSKVYYIITQGAGLGDQVFRLPVKGNETALDALSEIQGLSSTSSIRMWVARPGGNEQGGDQIMPIDWLGITQRGDVATNYQLMPGDRLYVAEDKLVAIDTALGKIISPVERIFGVTLLGTQTGNAFATYGTRNGSNF
ncbi:polysaccharide biosynthesis/export family protein [Aeoliella mucimassa]|nr:polysaccharide biosynthesis/export family protein [Aeoliella mucimassa]